MHNYLPSEITKFLDTGTLRLEKDSFIDNKLKESFSDLLFSTDIDGREGYIYFLFDHKSYPDKAVGLQLLKYMAEIWNTKIKKEKVKSVPPVIPLVIYHGTSGWHIEKMLGGMISGFNNFPPILRKYTPDYEYLVYDLTNYSDEEIKGEARVRILFTLFRDVRKVENVYELLDIINKAVTYLRELEDKQTGVEYFETLMRYIFSAAKNLTGEDAGKIADKVGKTYPEGSEVIMTLAEILREEGKKEGMELGAKQEKLQLATNALKEGMEIELNEKLTGLSRQEIEKIERRMGK